MAEDKRKERMAELANELFDLANEFALEKKPNVGVFLHESVNNIWRALKSLDGEKQAIPIDFFFRSMGLDMDNITKKDSHED